MSENSVVVPPGPHGNGIVTFDRGGHSHGHFGADWSQDFSRTGERVRADLSISDRFRAQEVRDVLACSQGEGVRNLIATKDLNLSLESNLGVMRKEIVELRGELRERVRDDGDKTRDLIRDNEAKAQAVALADLKAELALLKSMIPSTLSAR